MMNDQGAAAMRYMITIHNSAITCCGNPSLYMQESTSLNRSKYEVL